MKQDADLQELLLHSLLHDLKNQAHHLAIGLERLAPPPAQQDAWTQLCRVATQLGDQLTDALLAIRLNSHQHGLQLESVIIQTLLEDVAEEAGARLARTGVSFRVLPCPGLSHFLDSQLVLATLRSAADNAARHARSRVELSARSTEDSLLLVIEDDGPGFSGDVLHDPGAHAARASAEERRSGLGLLLARLTAEAHRHNGRQGVLILDSSPNLGGARFQLSLP